MEGIRCIRKDDTVLNQWSGGTTRELFIFPQESSYEARDFQFRLSIATVETDRSNFTSLEGVNRTTLILEGEIILHHEGHYVKRLRALESDSYNGEWESWSEGQCSDFNLMMRGKITGSAVPITINKGERFVQEPSDFWMAYYLFKGAVTSENVPVFEQEDLLILEEGKMVQFTATADSVLICCQVNRN